MQIWTESDEKTLVFEANGKAEEEYVKDFNTLSGKSSPVDDKKPDDVFKDDAVKSIDDFNLKVDQLLESKREHYQQLVDMSLEVTTILKNGRGV